MYPEVKPSLLQVGCHSLSPPNSEESTETAEMETELAFAQAAICLVKVSNFGALA